MVSRPVLSSDAARLMEIAAAFCANKQANQEVLSTTTLFFAAVEWGSQPNAPAPLNTLSAEVERIYGEGYQKIRAAFFQDGDLMIPPPKAADDAEEMDFELVELSPEIEPLSSVELTKTTKKGGPEVPPEPSYSRSVDAIFDTLKSAQDYDAVFEIIWSLLARSRIGSTQASGLRKRLQRMDENTKPSDTADHFDPALMLMAGLIRKPSSAPQFTEADREAMDDGKMWIINYKHDKKRSFHDRIAPGTVEPWKISPFGTQRISDTMNLGDIVAIWRTWDETGGGLIGWARVVDPVYDADQGLFSFEIFDAYPDTPVSRSRILDLLEPNSKNWPGQGSLMELPDAERDVFKLLLPLAPQPEASQTSVGTDRPETERDLLGRAPLAFAMASLVNQVFEATNEERVTADKSAFVVHIDSPWGGGKTTFVNFVARLLNPKAFGNLRPTVPDETPDSTALFSPEMWRYLEEDWSEDWRRADWLAIQFNAWTNQHVQPPWWNFYLDLRRQVLRAHLNRVKAPYAQASPIQRLKAAWLYLSEPVIESAWRVFTTGFVIQSLVFLLAAGAIFWGLSLDLVKNFIKEDSSINSALPALKLAIGGGTGIAIINSVRARLRAVAEAANGSADSTNLGVADPIERFRRRFDRFARRAGRPLFVVIDDVDRCKPDFVVALMRGLITIFNSPRVVFVILGDKDWIDQSFAIAHKDMKTATEEIDVSFGARFSEKVIQMSFLLPVVENAVKSDFAKTLLLIEDAPLTSEAENADADSDLENVTSAPPVQTEENPEAEASAITRTRDAQAAMADAASHETRARISHALMAFVAYLPSNPRRIKRFINIVAMYQASARVTLGIKPDTRDWHQLILWLLLMTEHPKLWRLFIESPARADRFSQTPASGGEINEGEEKELLAFLNREDCRAIVLGTRCTKASVRLDADAVAKLAKLTPV